MFTPRRKLLAASIALGGCVLLTTVAYARQTAAIWDRNASPAFAALQTASEEGRYAFVFFWKENNEPTKHMYEVLNSATAKMPNGVQVVGVSVTDPREQKTVELFGVNRAPLPLIAAVAPNGAVTKAWPLKVREEQLREGIVSDGTAKCMKALQERKLVLLCITNETLSHSAASTQAATGFKADARFAAATEVVSLDPSDSGEATFLHSLQVNPQTPEAVTVLLAPPGRPVARFVGAVTTDEIVAKVTSAQSGCCPGGQCGPGGCCPGGNCGPAK